MAKETKQDEYDPAALPDLLPIYYKKLFPYGPYYKWLNYGGAPKSYFQNREFSFTLKDDVYIRYQSFVDQAEMEKEIQKRCPYKIDIGAVFTVKPKDHKTVRPANFQPVGKELVFDIDMTDYDDVRSCCSGADICSKCWPLMTIAIQIVDRALREDFGFEHLFWVYSGRRGVHCWVCDEKVRKIGQAERTAIAEYLSVIKGGDNISRKVVLTEKVHPSISEALKIIEKNFPSYALKKQDFLGDEEKYKKVLQLVPDEPVRDKLEEAFQSPECATSAKRWVAIKSAEKNVVVEKTCPQSRQIVNEIMLNYTYPRLDVNVSKGVNHLLKSPFCIHPKTGRVCVPIDPSTLDSFDPFKVPRISEIIEELNHVKKTEDEENKKRGKDYMQTSLRPYMEYFQQFLNKLAKSWSGKLIEQSDQTMEF